AASGDSGRDGEAGPRSVTSQAMPTLAAVRDSDRTYQALASSAVAVTTASVAVRPAAVSSAARAAVSARIEAASSPPDMTRLTGRPPLVPRLRSRRPVRPPGRPPPLRPRTPRPAPGP